MMEAYFDESGTDDDSPVMCVAGYLFEQQAAIAMTNEWAEMLEKYQVPYIHMTELAPCKGVCEKLCMENCDDLAREVYALIHKYMTYGYAISVETKYQHLIPRLGQYQDIYTFACWQALLSIRNWSNDTNFNGKISYFFEAGHASERESSAVMAKLMENNFTKKAYRYHSHSFVQGKLRLKDGGVPIIQAGDVLAWHHCLNQKKKLNGIESRKDFNFLIDNDKHFVTHYDEASIRLFAKNVEQRNLVTNLYAKDWFKIMFPNSSWKHRYVHQNGGE